MKKKILNVALLACLGVGVLAGCGGSSITITNKEALKEEWHVGEAYRTVEITTDPETNISSAITTGDIVISSSDTSVVTTAGLNIYAVGDGDVTITATWGGVSDSVDLSILEQIFYEMPYTVGEQYYLGFLTSEGYKYIDGTTPEKYDYEGNLTMSLDEAVYVTLSDAGDGGYYLSFKLDEVTYYICIVLVGSYIDLQYLTEPTAVYWNREIGAFGTEDGEYFLCYNSAYDCFYASSVTSYGPSSDKASPIATLYGLDEAVESTPWVCPPEEAQYITTVPTSGGTYHLGLYNDYNADMYGTYYFTGTISNNFGATDTDVSKAAEVTVTPIAESSYTLSITNESKTQYIALVRKVKDSNAGTYYYNFDLVDSTANTDGEGTNPTYTTFTWDSTYNTMVVEGVDATNNDQNGTTYFMGTYSSYTTFGMSKYSYLSGDHQYPGRLYPVSNGTEN